MTLRESNGSLVFISVLIVNFLLIARAPRTRMRAIVTPRTFVLEEPQVMEQAHFLSAVATHLPPAIDTAAVQAQLGGAASFFFFSSFSNPYSLRDALGLIVMHEQAQHIGSSDRPHHEYRCIPRAPTQSI